MQSSTPKVIKKYRTVIDGQEVEVSVYTEGKTRRDSDMEVSGEGEIQEERREASAEALPLDEILKEIERYVEEEREEA